MTPWSANVDEIYGEEGAAVIDYDPGLARSRVQGDGAWVPIETDEGDRFVRELQH